MKLGRKEIGIGKRPYFIAEMSGNHNQSLEKALAIVDAAAAAGADALKIQTYTPDTMTLDLAHGEFFISDPKSLWKGSSLYDLYKVAMTPWEWHKPIQEKCESHGMDFFSTPFDASAVEFLEKLNVPFYKIASFENVDIPLIQRAARTGKPIIVSTGMASVSEIEDVVKTIRAEGNENIVLLKCTSAYPSDCSDSNIKTISHLRDSFGVEVGLSDHTMGWTVPIVAALEGASVIEKHFTISRDEGGVDSAFSMEMQEFKTMIAEVQNATKALGKVSYGTTKGDEKSLVFRRSLYIVADVAEGEVFTEKNVRAIRPGLGLPPKYITMVLGKRAKQSFKKGTALSWEAIS